MEDKKGEERRAELKRRYLEDGIEQLSEKEIIELLLRTSDVRVDAETLSEKLINVYGSLRSTFEAPRIPLREIGLNDKETALLMLMPRLYERYMISIAVQKYCGKALDTDEAIAEYIAPRLLRKRCEYVVLLLLSKRRRALYCGVVNDGVANGSDVDIRNILELCVNSNAEYAVLAHNHPSGIPLPSEFDITVTKRLIEKMALLGVTMLDHIIFSETDKTFLSKLEETKDLFGKVK